MNISTFFIKILDCTPNIGCTTENIFWHTEKFINLLNFSQKQIFSHQLIHEKIIIFIEIKFYLKWFAFIKWPKRECCKDLHPFLDKSMTHICFIVRVTCVDFRPTFNTSNYKYDELPLKVCSSGFFLFIRSNFVSSPNWPKVTFKII